MATSRRTISVPEYVLRHTYCCTFSLDALREGRGRQTRPLRQRAATCLLVCLHTPGLPSARIEETSALRPAATISSVNDLACAHPNSAQTILTVSPSPTPKKNKVYNHSPKCPRFNLSPAKHYYCVRKEHTSCKRREEEEGDGSFRGEPNPRPPQARTRIPNPVSKDQHAPDSLAVPTAKDRPATNRPTP